jgi:hypothetical protein
VQSAAQHEPGASSVPPSSAAGPEHAPAPEVLDEGEIARRKKISEANTGKVPWNKGRKHSPGGREAPSSSSQSHAWGGRRDATCADGMAASACQRACQRMRTALFLHAAQSTMPQCTGVGRAGRWHAWQVT